MKRELFTMTELLQLVITENLQNVIKKPTFAHQIQLDCLETQSRFSKFNKQIFVAGGKVNKIHRKEDSQNIFYH